MFENSNTVTFYNMSWQTVSNFNIMTDNIVKATNYIAMLLEYVKNVTSNMGCLTINGTEKLVTINIDKTTNNAKICQRKCICS